MTEIASECAATAEPRPRNRRGQAIEPCAIDFLPDEFEFERKVKTLTRTHLEVLALTARGCLNKQIAWLRGSSEGTVKAQQQEILRRLGLRSRTQAAVQFAIYCERFKSPLAATMNRPGSPGGPNS